MRRQDRDTGTAGQGSPDRIVLRQIAVTYTHGNYVTIRIGMDYAHVVIQAVAVILFTDPATEAAMFRKGMQGREPREEVKRWHAGLSGRISLRKL